MLRKVETVKKTKRFLACILLVFMFVISGMVIPDVKMTVSAATNYGLTVDANGTVLLKGKAFYGAGFNFFPTFMRHLDNFGDETYKSDFAMAKKYSVPFVRMPLGVYYPNQYKMYQEAPELYFFAMDDVIREAEKQNIGIIASLMWWDSGVSDLVGEPRGKIGDVNSKTVAFAKKYVADVVKRYKDSPAIWGWEVGNEYNLSADIMDSRAFPQIAPSNGTPETRSVADCYTGAQLATFYKEVGKEIRKYDTYRLITSGNGEMRPAAYHMELSRGGDWSWDTFEQFQKANGFYHPSPLNTVSFHLQHPEADLMLPRFAPKEGVAPEPSYILEYFKGYVKAAKNLKKGLFYGEFGDMMEWTTEGAAYKNNPELMKSNFYKVTKAMQDAGIQLSAIWMFRYEGAYHKITDTTDEAFKVVEVGQMNKNYRSKGQQIIDGYWPAYVEPSTSSGPSQSSGKTSSTTSSKGTSSKTTSSKGTSTGNGTDTSEDTFSDIESIVDSGESGDYTNPNPLYNLIRIKNEDDIVLSEENSTVTLNKTMSIKEFRKAVSLANSCAIDFLQYELEISDTDTMLAKGMTINISKDGEVVRTLEVLLSDELAAETKPATKDDESGSLLWLWILIAAVVVVGAGAAVFILVIKPKFFSKGKSE